MRGEFYGGFGVLVGGLVAVLTGAPGGQLVAFVGFGFMVYGVLRKGAV